jgi:hypothetical protein
MAARRKEAVGSRDRGAERQCKRAEVVGRRVHHPPAVYLPRFDGLIERLGEIVKLCNLLGLGEGLAGTQLLQ